MENEQLDRIEKKLEQVATVLLGVPDTDDGGLVEKVKENCQKVDQVNNRLWILIGLLVGSGVIGGSIWGIFG